MFNWANGSPSNGGLLNQPASRLPINQIQGGLRGCPQGFKLVLELPSKAAVVNAEEVFVVVAFRAAGPVVAPREKGEAVDHHELVVHVVWCAIHPHIQPSLCKGNHVGPFIKRFVIVRKQLNFNAFSMRGNQGVQKAVVAQCKYANL